jgi:tetratricopeptide (TPR) repeat protein
MIVGIFFVVLSFVSFIHAAPFKNIIHGSWWAVYQSASKNTALADDWFLDVISMDNSVCTHKGYIQYLYKHAKYADLIEYCKGKNSSLLDQDIGIKKLYGLALLQVGNIALSDTILIQIAQRDNPDLETCFYAASAYLRIKEFKKALVLIDAYLSAENKENGIFILYFLKSQLCLQLHQIHDARIACEQAVLLRPDFEKGWLLLGMLAEQEGDFSGAISGYKTYLDLDTQSAVDSGVYNGILSAIARNFFLKQGQEKKHFNGAIVMQNAKSCFDAQRYLQAIEHANQFLFENPSNIEMFCLKLESLLELERYDEVVTCLLDQIERYPASKSWYKVLDWCFEYGHVNHEYIVNRLQKIQDTHDQTVLPGLCIVDYYCNNQMFEKAIDTLNGLSRSVGDLSLKKILLFRLSDVYKEQKNYVTMIQELENILSIQPDNAIALELLADHYISVEKDYAKALDVLNRWRVFHALSSRALTKHGIVFYKQGQYQNAQELFLQAQLYDSSPLLFLHQAKVARKQGLHDEEFGFCQQAKQNATPTELERINKFLAKREISPRQSSS